VLMITRTFFLRANRLKNLLLVLLLPGCATGDWSDYNYGPGDWLAENTTLQVESMYNYPYLLNPTIEIHYVDSIREHCGSRWVQACSYLGGNHCDIFVGKLATPGTISHEERHCRGWSHYRPQFELFASMGPEFQAKEIARAGNWFPMDDTAMAIAMAPAVSHW
jgi:hypothetical protein